MPLYFNKHGAQRFRMPWGAVAGAAISVAGNAMTKKDNGGAGTTTATKEPWLPAQGWIADNLNSGQALQSQYAKNPQSAEQLAAVNNIYGQSDYMRGLVPSLLGQIGGQQVGFDPANPTARPKAWTWDGLLGGAPGLGQNSVANAALPAPAAAVDDSGLFKQYTPSPMASYYGILAGDPSITGAKSALQTSIGADAGGYGEFKYGQAMPAKGTKAYRDMQEYKQYGGNDPFNLYGMGPTSASMLDPASEFYDPNYASALRSKTNQSGGA